MSLWQTPVSLAAKVKALAERFGERCITGSDLGFWTDAHCAAVFGALREAEAVRLCWPLQRPDFEVRVLGAVRAYELTEADHPGRRRGDEYRAHPDEPYPDPWPALTPDMAHHVLEAAAIKKARVNYPPGTGLLVYLNPGDFDHHTAEIVARMPGALRPALQHFAEVWVLWKGAAYRVTGQAAEQAISPAG